MFKDKRGIIKDLMVGEDWSVTYISFKKGAVRGNHYHEETDQHDFIIKGKLVCQKDNQRGFPERGDTVHIEAGRKHAYEALEDSEMISICLGKRIGDDYSKDTYALQEPLIKSK